MNVKTFCRQGLLGRLLVTMAVGSLALSAMAAGTIQFAEKYEASEPGGDRCSVPVPAAGSPVKSISFKSGEYNCKNDQYRYFRFDDVPSPTFVVMTSDKQCDDNEWKMGVLTIKHPTSTSWKAIQDIRGTAMGGIVTPGIVKQEDNGKGGTDKGTLSCLEIYAPDP
ncbi:hypothetical protein [Pseudomonas xanthosomatis]|uniref:hypothetical protein n=1 Tax=Pseudomonas xanthosomatis TaxID=2842356 RepID=UPI0035169538